MTSDEKDALIADATTLALSELASWQRPRVLPGVGPQPIQVFLDFEKALGKLRSDINAHLVRIPIDELKRDYCQQSGIEFSPFHEEHGIHHAISARIKALSAIIPEWFSGGWTVDGRLPDIGHWNSASVVALEEAALLTVAVEPRMVDYKSLFRSYGLDSRTDQVLYFLEDRYEEIARGLAVEPKPETQVSVDRLVGWIVATGVPVAAEFRAIFKSKFASAQKTLPKEASDMHHHTEHALHRIIVTLAISHYKLSSEKDAARVARLIVAEGELLGFTLSKRALKKILLAGFKQLDGDAKAAIEDR